MAIRTKKYFQNSVTQNYYKYYILNQATTSATTTQNMNITVMCRASQNNLYRCRSQKKTPVPGVVPRCVFFFKLNRRILIG